MIDEAVGKILGMAMAYLVSSLGLFLAYANYRRRTLGAEKVMTPTAWAVIATVVVVIGAGVAVVANLAEAPPPESEVVAEVVSEPEPPVVVEPAPPVEDEPAPRERPRWPLLGMVAPAAVFLFATWVTSALYRHFAGLNR